MVNLFDFLRCVHLHKIIRNPLTKKRLLERKTVIFERLFSSAVKQKVLNCTMQSQTLHCLA